MRLRVRSKLVLYISIPLVITYILMLGWDYAQQRSDTRAQAENLVLGRAELSAAILDARLAQAEQSARSLAEAIALRQERPVARPDLRARWMPRAAMAQLDWAEGLVVAFEDPTQPGMVVHRIGEPGVPELPPGLNYNSPDTAWYWTAKQTHEGAWFAPSDVAGIFPHPTIAYSFPILVEGEFRGVVCLHISPDVFHFALKPRPLPFGRPTSQPSTMPAEEADSVTFNLHMERYLIASGSGEVVFHSPPNVSAPASLNDPAIRPVRALLDDALVSARRDNSELVALRDVPVTMFDLRRGHNYWVTVTPIRSGKWLMLSTYPEARYMGPINHSLIRRSAFLFAGMCFMLAIVAFASRRISRPLEELEHSTQALGAGNLDVAVPEPRGRDEVAQLSRMFNAMLQRLRAQMQQIREESEARARVESELQLARQIQTSLLPREMLRGRAGGGEDAGFEIHACNLPASHVAGDFYDFFVDSAGRVMLVIADVAGHGMAAALLMAVTRTLIRNLAASGLSPAEVALQTNRSLLDNGAEGMFVTLVLCIYDPKTGELTYTNAGHPGPLVMRASGEVMPTGGSTAPLLGAYSFDAPDCIQRTLCLAPGDTLALYTDGILEARPNYETEEFGQGRFCNALGTEARRSRPLAEICQGVVEAVQDYQRGPLADDLTLLLVRRL